MINQMYDDIYIYTHTYTCYALRLDDNKPEKDRNIIYTPLFTIVGTKNK